MNGERDLATLKRRMAPQMHDQTFVYCTFPDNRVPAGLTPICTFHEAEGLTAIAEKSQAERFGVPYEFESRLITMTVYSSLDAVGFLAALTRQLADAHIPCNVVAGYHHDHLFVPVARASQAFELLSAMGEALPAR